MVVRPSSSSWSLCPEKIMSHHFRLTSGIRPVVDTSPPYSMYNSPISVHYIPKRASSADAAKRNTLQRPHRELSAFINSNTPNLRLPLPLRSSRNELVKPKLLGNRNYNPPVRRTPVQHKPPLPVPQPQPHYIQKEPERERENPKRRERSRRSQAWVAFKDCVYSFIIKRGVFTDGIIIDTVESEMEKWEDQLPWSQLEALRDEIYDELGVRREEVVRVSKTKQKRGSSVGSSGASTSSSASSSSSSSGKSSKSSGSSSASSGSSTESRRSQSEESSSSQESSRSQSSDSSLSTRTSSSKNSR